MDFNSICRIILQLCLYTIHLMVLYHNQEISSLACQEEFKETIEQKM